MKKFFVILIGFLFPVTSFAAYTIPWNGTTTSGTILSMPVPVSGIRPIPYSPYYIASSTTNVSVFPNASTTNLSATVFCLTGDICRTTWPTGGGSSIGEAWSFFNSKAYLAPTTTVGIIVNASSTIGNATVAGGLTINGGATTSLQTILAGTSGNVGIGTTTPNWSLQVASTTPYIAITDTNAPVGGKHWFLQNNDGLLNIGTSTDALNGTSSIAQFSGNFLGLSVYDGANGIGSTSPFAKLSIHANPNDFGGYYPTLFAVASSTASATTTIFQVNASGNVGIGTTSPIMKLDVYGQIRATNPTKPSCTATILGAIQYDVSDDHFYGCRVGGWVQLDN